MKQTVTVHTFRDAFRDYGRLENFTYEGLGALYELLTDYEEGTGDEFELDVVSLCCEFTEYKDLDEVIESYPDIQTIEDLQDHTIVYEFEGGLIVGNF
jgi:hypothetical protein